MRRGHRTESGANRPPPLTLLAIIPYLLLSLDLSAESPTPTPSASQVSCPDQAVRLLPQVEPLVQEFKDERRTALATSRISLGPLVARLEDVQRKTRRLEEWPESLCGYALREKLDAAESYDVGCLKAFLENRRTCERRKEDALWADADRQLRALQELAAKTRQERQ